MDKAVVFNMTRIANLTSIRRIDLIMRVVRKNSTTRRRPMMRESSTKNDFLQMVKNYVSYKREKTGSGKINKSELDSLKEAFRNAERRGVSLKEAQKPSGLRGGKLNDFNTLVENFRAHKKARLGESTVTYKEIKMLREACDKANRLGRKLAEADANFDAGAQQQPAAGADPNAAATGGAAVSPDVQSQIQNLLSQVQSLAQAAGVQTADFGADPNANLPAVDGMGTADAAAQQQPAADPNAPLMEAVAKIRKENGGKCDEENFAAAKAKFGKTLVESIGLTRDRIAMRSAKLDTLNEGYKGDFASAYFANVGLKEATSPIMGIPSEKEIAHGTADAAKGLAKELKTPVAWPDHQITGAPIQGEGAKQQKVKESASSSVTDAYVENFYAPKLSLDTIRESMKTGLLG